MYDENPVTQNSFSLKRAFFALKRGVVIIIACFLFGLLLSYGFLAYVPPKFKASVQVLFDPIAEQIANPEQGFPASILTLKALERAIALIQSPGILLKVADNLKSYPISNNGIDTSIQRILRDDRLNEGIRERKLLEGLQRDLTVRTEGADQIIIIEYQSRDAQEAAYIANLIVKTFIDQRTKSRKEAVSQATQWIEGQFFEVKESYSAIEKKIQDYKAEHKIDDRAGFSVFDAQLVQLRGQLSLVELKLSDAETIYKTLQSYDSESHTDFTNLLENLNDPNLQRLRTSLAEAEAAASAAASRFGSYYPEAKSKQILVQTLREEIKAEARRKLIAAKSDMEALRNQQMQLNVSIITTEGKVRELRAAEIKLGELLRERETIKPLYDSLLGRLTKAAPQQSLGFSDFKILIDAAVPQDRKINPIIIWMAGGSGGLAIGILICLMLEFLSGRLVDLQGLENQLPLKIIGRLPILAKSDFPENCAREHPDNYKQFARSHPESLFTNCLLPVLFALRELESRGGAKVIMITSPAPGNGKTFITANIAGLLALLRKKVLLLDFDARKAMPGDELTNAGQITDLDAFLHEALGAALTPKRDAAGFDWARLPASGKAVWLQFLQPQIVNLLKLARDEYEYVLIDTPPAGIFSDAAILAGQADGIVIVAEWSRSSIKQVRETHDMLLDHRGKVLGLLVNKVKVDSLISESMTAYNSYYSGQR